MHSLRRYVTQHGVRLTRIRDQLRSPHRVQPAYSTVVENPANVDGESDVKISTKPEHTRLPKRKPFMKNMFIGVVDTDLLVYPESLNREEQARLVNERKTFEKIFESEGAQNVATQFRNAGLFGLQAPLNYGGKLLIETELAYFNEIVANDFNSAMIVGQHNIIVQLITQYGSDALKEKYLDRLSSGELVASVAIFEEDAPNDTMFCTTITPDLTDNKLMLHGSKSFVVNGADANLFLVLASTNNLSKLATHDSTVGVILVEADSNGVVKSAPDSTLGLNEVPQVTVKFNQVEVPQDNMIGTSDNAIDVLVQLLKSVRVQTSVLGVHKMKAIINSLTKHCINAKSGAGQMMDLEHIRQHLARSVCATYAAESMIYMTTGLLDDFEGQDAEMEAAITKVFTGEELLQMVLKPVQFVGAQALVRGHEFELLLRDIIQFYGQGEQLDSVKLFIALSGLQYAGLATYETIKKDRNPAMNPSYVISKLFEKNSVDNPKKFVEIQQFLHPSLDPAANWIEFSIMRLKLASEYTLSRHGVEVVKRHIELARIADIAALIYAMIASASRASRSYCIGLRHGDQEIHLANTFCQEGCNRIKTLAKELEHGQFITSDHDNEVIARNLFRQKQYFFEHPTTRNF